MIGHQISESVQESEASSSTSCQGRQHTDGEAIDKLLLLKARNISEGKVRAISGLLLRWGLSLRFQSLRCSMIW